MTANRFLTTEQRDAMSFLLRSGVDPNVVDRLARSGADGVRDAMVRAQSMERVARIKRHIADYPNTSLWSWPDEP